ncbi:hypothetical protein FOZ63_020624, partial [Perkinsus olseni]
SPEHDTTRHRHMTCGWDSDVDRSIEDAESVVSGPETHTVMEDIPRAAEDVDEETKLTEKVPELLEAMNSSAERLNALERELSTIERRRHHLATEWRRRKQQLLPVMSPIGYASGPAHTFRNRSMNTRALWLGCKGSCRVDGTEITLA